MIRQMKVGLPFVHFSAQIEPFLSKGNTQTEPFLPLFRAIILVSLKQC